jgi:hypothetical protein
MNKDKWWLGPVVFGVLLLLTSWTFLLFPKWIDEPAWIVHERERRLFKLHQLLICQKNDAKRRREFKKKLSKQMQILDSHDAIPQISSSSESNNTFEAMNCSEFSQIERLYHKPELDALGAHAAAKSSGIVEQDMAISLPLNVTERNINPASVYTEDSENFKGIFMRSGAKRQLHRTTATSEISMECCSDRYCMKSQINSSEGFVSSSSASQSPRFEREISG